MGTTERRSRGIHNLSISERVKTIHWKFYDIVENYPQLSSTKGTHIKTPLDFYFAFKFLFDHETKEKFVVFWLNSVNIVIGYEIISEGTLNTSIAHAREVFRGAIVSSCHAIIVAHNHPSGAPNPSQEDVTFTNKLIEAGKIIGIQVLDHFIFTNSNCYSFTQKGSLILNEL